MYLIIKGKVTKAICCACQRLKPAATADNAQPFLCSRCRDQAHANMIRMMDEFPETRDRRLNRYRDARRAV